MKVKKIILASDHAGFILKEQLKKSLSKKYNIIDLGCDSDKSVHYPDYAKKLCDKIENNDKGILICGTGNGMLITANRNDYIRAGLAYNVEIAKLIRQHNDANILVLPGRFIDVQEALKCVDIFLTTKFEFGRHKIRIDKIGK